MLKRKKGMLEMTQEEEINPSARFSKPKKLTREEELQENIKIWINMYEQMRDLKDTQEAELEEMQRRMFLLSILLMILGFLIGRLLGGI